MNSRNKSSRYRYIFRIISGVITAIGAVILFISSLDDQIGGVVFAGFLTLLIGISNIAFANMAKKFDVSVFIREKKEKRNS